MKSVLFFIAVLLSMEQSRAQIVVHEATDVTQSKATLSADFPNVVTEHGFLYKQGKMSQRDGFAAVILSEASDVVAFNRGENPWTANAARAWVESCNDPTNPQLLSSLSTTFTLTAPTEVSFEWKVSSEEGIGTLSYAIDGHIKESISGETEFVRVTVGLDSGEHTLTWEYSRTTTENVGYGQGYLRQISISNTTPGNWLTADVESNTLRLEGLLPGTGYLYQAFSKDSTGVRQNSAVRQFATKDIHFGKPQVNDTTQTTATVILPLDAGDAVLRGRITLSHGNYVATNAFADAILSSDSDPSAFTTTGGWTVKDGKAYNKHSGYYYEYVSTTVTFYATTVLSFTWSATATRRYGSCGIDFKATSNDVIEASLSITGGYNGGTTRMERMTFEPGTYTLSWVTQQTYEGGVLTIDNLHLSNTCNTRQQHVDTLDMATDFSCQLRDLLPRHLYYVDFHIEPDRISSLAGLWTEPQLPTLSFLTKDVVLQTLSPSERTHTSAVLRAKAEMGDAIPMAYDHNGYMRFQYRQQDATRWSEKIATATGDTLEAHISRLRPATAYEFRPYLLVEGIDTVFGQTETFQTDTLLAFNPTVAERNQHSVKLNFSFNLGDALVYGVGWQIRPYGSDVYERQDFDNIAQNLSIQRDGLLTNTLYQVRSYVVAPGQDTIYSSPVEVRTRNLEAYVDTITDVWQHTATVRGHIISEDPVRDANLIVYRTYLGQKYQYDQYPKQTLPISIDHEGSFTVRVDSLSEDTEYGFDVEVTDEKGCRTTSLHTIYEHWLDSDSIRPYLADMDFKQMFLSHNPVDSITVLTDGGWNYYCCPRNAGALFGFQAGHRLKIDFYISLDAWGDDVVWRWRTSRCQIGDKWRSNARLLVSVDGGVPRAYSTEGYDEEKEEVTRFSPGRHTIEWTVERIAERDTVNSAWAILGGLSLRYAATPWGGEFPTEACARTKSYFKPAVITNVTQTSADVEITLEDTPVEPESIGIASLLLFDNQTNTWIYDDLEVQLDGRNMRIHLDNLHPSQGCYLYPYVTTGGQFHHGNVSVETRPVYVTATVDSVAQTAVWLTINSIDSGTAHISRLRYRREVAPYEYAYVPLPEDGQIVVNGFSPSERISDWSLIAFDHLEDTLVVGPITTFLADGDTLKWVSTLPITHEILPVTDITGSSATLNALLQCDNESYTQTGFYIGTEEYGYGIRNPLFIPAQRLGNDTIQAIIAWGSLNPSTQYFYRPVVMKKDGDIYHYYDSRTPSFTTLEESVGMSDVGTDSPMCIAGYRSIQLLNIAGKAYRVTNMAGLVFASDRTKKSSVLLSLPQGVYVVNVGGVGWKVLVR